MDSATLIPINRRSTPDPSTEISLRDQIDNILAERHESLKAAISKWLLYCADFGSQTAQLEDCPIALSKSDQKFVVRWLEDEGFDVKSPKYFGAQTLIYLTS